jgi:hypothetical protein
MLEVSNVRKAKINLTDYNCKQDIENRIVLSDFTPFDLSVLEEILFSSLKISLKKLIKSLDTSEEQISPILIKLQISGLLDISGDVILVDKDKRKYFEFQCQRFDPQFKPDMEFLQGLLKQVPIHVLPTWYSIPRTSNNIFESLIEKYLLTPQIFERYLSELQFQDPVLTGIMEQVLLSHQPVSSSDLIAKFNLTREAFEEAMLHLEFSFVCSLRYLREEDYWHEVVTPFHEWDRYQKFLIATECNSLKNNEVKTDDVEFKFILEMEKALSKRTTNGISPSILDKISLLKLGEVQDTTIYPTGSGHEWLEYSLENKSLYLYRHPFNKLSSLNLPIDKNIRESEKAIKRVLDKGWVLFDDFIQGCTASLNDCPTLKLCRTGKIWQYHIPKYSSEEIHLIHQAIFEWLNECGITMIGQHNGKDCFCVTPFGRLFFAD